ncbi:hypothetical protein H0H92_014258, partial [Tricholoma furcatifolium]
MPAFPSIRIRLKQSDLSEDLPAVSLPTASYTPQPGPSRPRAIKSGPKLPKLTFIGHGKTLQQRNTFLPRKDQPPPLRELPHDPENPFFEHGDDQDIGDTTRHRQKRANQWKRWQEEVIPSLIDPYMTYLYQSDSLRELPFRRLTSPFALVPPLYPFNYFSEAFSLALQYFQALQSSSKFLTLRQNYSSTSRRTVLHGAKLRKSFLLGEAIDSIQ